jgi:hypothetical protein
MEVGVWWLGSALSELMRELDENLRREEEEVQRWHERWDDRSGDG